MDRGVASPVMGAVLLISLILSMAGAALAGGDNRRVTNSKPQLVAKATMPPFAYIQFCVHNPAACRDTPGRLDQDSSMRVRLEPHLMRQLTRVNTQVNGSIKLADDRSGDRWSVNVSRGDCEDYVLTKRARLIAAGWPSSALSIAIVRTRSSEGHAVLIARTTKGDMVLDNLTPNVKPIRYMPYRLVSMQGTSAMKWVLTK